MAPYKVWMFASNVTACKHEGVREECRKAGNMRFDRGMSNVFHEQGCLESKASAIEYCVDDEILPQ